MQKTVINRVIKVTKEHIKLGQKGRYCFCPVAIALLDAGYDNVSVDGDDISFRANVYGDTYNVEVESPKKVSEFVDLFDEGEKGGKTPFSFKLSFDLREQARAY